MLKKLSLKSMVQYEKLTKNNAFALFQKTEKSAKLKKVATTQFIIED